MVTEIKLNKRFDDCIEGFIESDGNIFGEITSVYLYSENVIDFHYIY